MSSNIKLGCMAKDRMTGFTGVVTATAQYICCDDEVCIEAMVGGEPKSFWFDRSRVDAVAEDEGAQ